MKPPLFPISSEPGRFLPTSPAEVEALGWEELDVILVTGDAYVDHPSFGAAVIGRLLEAEGYRVAVLPQPNWQDDLRDWRKLGAPRLFFGVTAGNMDSMVNHYTAARRLRSDDAYTAGGRAGFRPDYAATHYTRLLKRLYPHTPVVLGGIEASLRRLTHYDYWSDRLLPSILCESGADLLLYGMGERSVVALARMLHNGFNLHRLKTLAQVAYVADRREVDRLDPSTTLHLHSYEECVRRPEAFAENFTRIETESNLLQPERTLVEGVGERYVVVRPPCPRLTTEELDRSFDLPYLRAPHPRYRSRGPIPAWEMIKHSVNIHRGCFGGCSFCTISAHQGKFISSRSRESILNEVGRIALMPDFRGTITDIGGPSANMYGMSGRDEALCLRCRRPSCLFPARCANLRNDHGPLLDLYRAVEAVPGVRHLYVGSGIRYDLFDDHTPYLKEVVCRHTSGRLKVAPEHTEDDVLQRMRKPPFALFERLDDDFRAICSEAGLRYQIVPYFISSHPGCTDAAMRSLAERTRRMRYRLEQVQDFTPTPMTLSSVMYFTGLDPYTGRPLFVERSAEGKARQKAHFFDRPAPPLGRRAR